MSKFVYREAVVVFIKIILLPLSDSISGTDMDGVYMDGVCVLKQKHIAAVLIWKIKETDNMVLNLEMWITEDNFVGFKEKVLF